MQIYEVFMIEHSAILGGNDPSPRDEVQMIQALSYTALREDKGLVDLLGYITYG